MHWESDEEGEIQEDEIQKDERRFGVRDSHIKEHRWKGFPLYEEDDFAKRLGPRSKFDLHEEGMERTNSSLSANVSRKRYMEETSRSSKSNEVVKVTPRCCGFPCNSSHDDGQKSYRFAISSKEPPTRSFKTKEPNSLGAILTRKFFRPKIIVEHPPWENGWTLLQERFENEMQQLKELRLDVQEMCQEMKRMGSRREDTSGLNSPRWSVSEAHFRRIDELGQSKRHPQTSHIREKSHHQPNRRAKSAPRIRVNWNSDLPDEDIEDAPAPTASLFKEVIREKRLYLRKFIVALIKYEESRSSKDAVKLKQSNLRQAVARLLPHAIFANLGQFKYGIEAWLSQVVFQEFEIPEEREQGSRARQYAWKQYRKLSLLCPVDAINNGKDHCENFHEFCNLKFNTIRNQLKWLEDWPDELVMDLLESAKYVWLAKNLAAAFDPVATHFIVNSSAKFDARLMEPVDTPNFFQTNCLQPPSAQVGFSVSSGYFVRDRIIKCQVCLASHYSSDSR